MVRFNPASLPAGLCSRLWRHKDRWGRHHGPGVRADAIEHVATQHVRCTVQTLVERREVIDTKRSAVFFGFGLVQVPPACMRMSPCTHHAWVRRTAHVRVQVGFVQYALYCNLYARLFPSAAAFAEKTLSAKLQDLPGMLNVLKQLIIDQFIYHPLCYFPVFYTCKVSPAEQTCAHGWVVEGVQDRRIPKGWWICG